jgi:hypothetical protein
MVFQLVLHCGFCFLGFDDLIEKRIHLVLNQVNWTAKLGNKNRKLSTKQGKIVFLPPEKRML